AANSRQKNPGADEAAGNSDEAADACRRTCRLPACGDGVIDGGEECDDGADNTASGACTPLCRTHRCGDGYVYADGEECDDGNKDDGDGCTNDCKSDVPLSCGDGIAQAGEECDLGEENSDDALSAKAGACKTDCTAWKCHTEDESTFDIEKSSSLGSVYSSKAVHKPVPGSCPTVGTAPMCKEGATDAVVLTRDEPGEWTLNSVEVLIAVPSADWDNYPDDAELSVLVWNGSDPTATRPVRASQKLQPKSYASEVPIENYNLDPMDPANEGDLCSGDASCPSGFMCSDLGLCQTAYRLVWWRFDLSKRDVTLNETYVVGVEWPDDRGYPLVASSSKDQSCSRNWSDINKIGEDGLKQNKSDKKTCNVP
ncbi:MAG: DUF4215 domain-containing protein, partial [Myxococcota bacterium]